MISSDQMVSGVQLVAALGCGLMAGVFFAFSTFVMKALLRLPAEQGIAAMQSINIFAVKSWFLVAFLGTAVACGFAIVFSFLRWSEASSLLLAGGAIFLIGCFLVTILFNVPMNNALAAMPADDPGHATRWASYLTRWTRWNHVRTIASLAAAALLIMGWATERCLGTYPRQPIDRLQSATSELRPERLGVMMITTLVPLTHQSRLSFLRRS